MDVLFPDGFEGFNIIINDFEKVTINSTLFNGHLSLNIINSNQIIVSQSNMTRIYIEGSKSILATNNIFSIGATIFNSSNIMISNNVIPELRFFQVENSSILNNDIYLSFRNEFTLNSIIMGNYFSMEEGFIIKDGKYILFRNNVVKRIIISEQSQPSINFYDLENLNITENNFVSSNLHLYNITYYNVSKNVFTDCYDNFCFRAVISKSGLVSNNSFSDFSQVFDYICPRPGRVYDICYENPKKALSIVSLVGTNDTIIENLYFANFTAIKGQSTDDDLIIGINLIHLTRTNNIRITNINYEKITIDSDIQEFKIIECYECNYNYNSDNIGLNSYFIFFILLGIFLLASLGLKKRN